MSDTDAQVPVSDLGARLLAARERLGWTVAEAASRLHCDASVIDALEQERFDELGAFVYARGHVRRYAELVGESAPELQELLARRMQNTPHLPDLTRVPKAERAPDTRSLIGPVIAGASALLIAAMVWWVLKGNRSVGELVPMEAPSAVTTPPPAAATAAAASPAAAPAGAANDSVNPPPGAAPTTAPAASADEIVATEHNLGGVAPVAAMPAATIPAAAAEPLRPQTSTTTAPAAAATTAAASSAAAAAIVVPTAAAPGAKLLLRLTASKDCWIEAYDPAGKRIYYGMATPNSVQQIGGAAPLRVLLGNVRAVKLEVNGKLVTVPEDVRRGSSAYFAVGADGQIRIAAEQGPTPGAGDARQPVRR